MTKFKQGDRVVPEQMTTTERIVEAVKAEIIKEYGDMNTPIENVNGYFITGLVKSAIASVIGKERHTIRERPDKLILDKADELYGKSPSLKECHAFREGCKWMYKYLLTEPLSDLTPKTDTTDGE